MLAEIIPRANIILVGNIVVETHDRASLPQYCLFYPIHLLHLLYLLLSFYLLHLFILSSASNTLALGVPMFMRMNPSPSGP